MMVWVAAFCAACTVTPADVTGAGTQLATRAIQSREYDALGKPMTMRAAIATLQDLGFTIDTADMSLGIITGTRLDKYTMRVTITIAEKGASGIAVRANARIDEDTVTDPNTYRDFFMVLDKAMYLALHKVD
jgi:hypothetical protein